MTKVAIMQPTYLPWIGYFGLMMTSDIFILLDNVQFEKRSWQQRNQIKTKNGKMWLTVPVKSKNKFHQNINDVQISTDEDFKKKHLNSIKLNYIKSKFFKSYEKEFIKLYDTNHKKLVSLNFDIIYWFKEKLEIKTKILRSSDLNVDGKKDLLIANLVKNVNSTSYIFNQGSENYILKSDEFKKKNIDLYKFEFKLEKYNQLYGDFIPNMSIIDLLFNIGNKSKDYILKNISLKTI